jgi:hypothetical protein
LVRTPPLNDVKRGGTRLPRLHAPRQCFSALILEAKHGRHAATGWSAIDSVSLYQSEIAAGTVYARPIAPAPIRNIVLATSHSAALSSAARVTALEIRRSIKGTHPANGGWGQQCETTDTGSPSTLVLHHRHMSANRDAGLDIDNVLIE